MQITINGQAEQLQEATSILGLLQLKEVANPEMVSVELNGEILEQEEFATTQVKAGDQIEFLYFMGGGA